jgi:hypothetical protein
MIEILAISLKPGKRDEFHRLYLTKSLPLQEKWKIDVIAHGPSLHDETSYYVVRSYKSLDERKKSEDDFYNSDDWQKGPRGSLMSSVRSVSTIVISEETFKKWSDGM